MTANAPALQFDPASHEYRFAVRRVPSVTQVIADFFPPSPFYTEAGRVEGSALHTCCHFLSEGDLDWESVSPIILPRVKSFEKFLSDTGFAPSLKEQRLYSETLGVAGTLDAAGMMDGRRVLIEYKRGAFLPTHRLQTAAYALMTFERGFGIEDRYSLHLGLDGYNLIKHDDDDDEECFRALVSAYHVKQRYSK